MTTDDTGFLAPPPQSAAADRLFAHDREAFGFVMNLSRAWAHHPEVHDDLFALLGRTAEAAGLTYRQRGVLISALASTMRDPHCSLAWGTPRRRGGDEVAADVLRGEDDRLDPAEQALAAWARQVARDPNGTGAAEVEALRAAGYDDGQIAALTMFVALRIAFSTVNDALGAHPGPELVASAPAAVRDAVTYGRGNTGLPSP